MRHWGRKRNKTKRENDPNTHKTNKQTNKKGRSAAPFTFTFFFFFSIVLSYTKIHTMTTLRRTSWSAENTHGDDGDTIVLPASMQTLVDRYTERTLNAEERATLAGATPNVRCEALRLFFEANDAAAAVEYVLRHGGHTPAPSSQRHSGEQSTSSSATSRSKASNSASRSAASVKSQKALASLPTNATNLSFCKLAAEPKQTSRPAALHSNPPVAAMNVAESPAPTPLKQQVLRPPSLSVGGGGTGAGANSGSRPRRVSAARRGESTCTLVTVSSMSDDDDDVAEDRGVPSESENSVKLDDYDGLAEATIENEQAAVAAAATTAFEEGEEMPPTVTLRAQESHRSSRAAVAATSQVPALALDSVVKPNAESANRLNAPSPTISAPVDRPSRNSTTPITATTPTAAGGLAREASPSVLPPPGAQRIETSILPSPSPAAAALPPMPHGPPAVAAVNAGDDGDEEEPRKTVAAKPTPITTTTAAVEKDAEPAAAMAVPLTALTGATETAADVAKKSPPRQQQRHHVAFTDAKAMAVLDTYRQRAVPPSYLDEVELAYTELSCGHSSASPSCVAPSVASGGATKNAMDWAALVASVRAPQLLAPGATSLPSAARKGRRTTTTTAAVAPAVCAPHTPRGSTATTAAAPSQLCRTPRGSQEEGDGPTAAKRKSGGGAKNNNTAVAAAAATSKKSAAGTRQRQTRRKRLSGQCDTPGSSSSAVAAPHNAAALMTPDKSQICSTNASPLKRGVAWDDTTGMYITHPNQRRRQLAAAAAAAESTATAATPPHAAMPSLAIRAAGASALDTPDVLRAYFGRTPSTAVMAAAEGEVTTPRPHMGVGVPPSNPLVFGRLCSAASHLAVSRNDGSRRCAKNIAKTPHPAAAKRKPATRGSPITSTTDRILRKKRTKPTPVVATPRPHNAPPPSATAGAMSNTNYARLRSGYPAVQPHDVYREGGEVISLQRQASQYHAALYASTETLRRIASAVPAIRRATEGGEDTIVRAADEIQLGGPIYCPSTIRSPRTARTSREGETAAAYNSDRNNNGGWLSARGPLYHRSASNYHPHPVPPHSSNISGGGGAPVPTVQCDVFERLTSNYYAVYSSAAALQTATLLTSPRGGRVARYGAGGGAHSARRRHMSAPAARRAARRNPYPALREGWLSPDGKVAATRRVEVEATEEVEAAPAPAENVFTRSNTSRYLNVSN